MASLRKRIASLLLAAIAVACLSGCAEKPYKLAYYRAENYANAIVAMDYSRIVKFSDSIDGTDDVQLKTLCDLHEAGIFEDYNKVANSLSCKIDVDTLETNDDKASVDVIFTMLDWKSDDLDKAKNTDITVTLSLKLVKGKWVVTNSEDVFTTVYGFSELTASNANSEYNGTWWFTDSGSRQEAFTNPTYTNTFHVGFDIDTTDIDDTSNIYYTVAYDNTIEYVSEIGYTEGYYNAVLGADVDERGFLLPGRYTISFYSGERLLISDSCTVINE